jgi:hypothetical protein
MCPVPFPCWLDCSVPARTNTLMFGDGTTSPRHPPSRVPAHASKARLAKVRRHRAAKLLEKTTRPTLRKVKSTV